MNKELNTIKISLTLGDRISIAAVLPEKDSFERLIIREQIIQRTAISPAEIEKYEIKTDRASGVVTWNDGLVSFKFDFTDQEAIYITDNLKVLSQEKNLTFNLLGMYKQFING